MPTPEAILAALLHLEQLRHPHPGRTELVALLTQVADDLHSLTGARSVRLALCAAAFTPPFPLTVVVGDPPSTPPLPTHLQWGGVTLAHLDLAPGPAADGPTALLVRVATESLAAVWASEHTLAEAEARTRAQIALELHDAGKQVLPAIRLFAECAEHALASNPAATAHHLRSIREIAQQGLDDMAFWLGELHGQHARDDVSHALERLLRQTADAAPQLTLTCQSDLPALSWRVAACLLGMLRGALANVLLHANARTVQVGLQPTAGGVMAFVHDDGVGIDLHTALAAPGLGLESIFERTRHLGGHVTLQPGPHGGTWLEIWLPLTPTEVPCG